MTGQLAAARAVASDPLDALAKTRWALEGSSDFWATVLQLATVAVVIGVVIEVGATIFEIFEDRKAGKPLAFHAYLTLIGGAVVAAAVAFEGLAEIRGAADETALRQNNAAAQSELDKRSREATAQAVSIANKFGGLQSLVTQKEKEMDASFDSLRNFAQGQKKRVDSAISSLNVEESKVQTARTEAEASAGKAASAAASMMATLDSERQMQAQMRAIITHRTLTDTEVSTLVEKLKPFTKTPFDLSVFDEPDSRDLAIRIASALEQAGWDWRDAPSVGGLVIHAKKQIAILTLSGISLEIAESKKNTDLEKATIALHNALVPKGWTMKASATPDSQIDKAWDKSNIHVFVGVRG